MSASVRCMIASKSGMQPTRTDISTSLAYAISIDTIPRVLFYTIVFRAGLKWGAAYVITEIWPDSGTNCWSLLTVDNMRKRAIVCMYSRHTLCQLSILVRSMDGSSFDWVRHRWSAWILAAEGDWIFIMWHTQLRDMCSMLSQCVK